MVYQVGRFRLIPFRELMDGRDLVSIGRKPLEILSVLAAANGALVTKDELMAAVWPDLIVEENAIQAHIAALRRILGPDAGLLTTSRGMGYRLAASPAEAEETAGSSPRRRPQRRALAATLAVILAVVLAAAGWWVVRRPASPAAPHRPSIGMGGFTAARGDPAEAALAAAMNAEVPEALSRYDVTVIGPRPGAGPDPAAAAPDFIVRGRVAASAEGFTVTTDLADRRSNILVYSFDTLQPRGAAADVSAAIASHVALSLDPSKLTSGLDGKLTPADYTIVARFNDAADRWDPPAILDQTQKLAERYPRNSDLQGSVAMGAVYAAQAAPRSEKARYLDLARRSIRRSEQLSPNSAVTALAKGLLTNGPMSYAAQERLARRALQLDPGQHVAYNGLGEVMLLVGRTREGIALVKRSVQLDPMSHVVVFGNLHDLIKAGAAEDALQLLAREQLIWPGEVQTHLDELYVATYFGDPDKVVAAGRTLGPPAPGVDASRLALNLQAWRTRDPAVIRRMAASCFGAYGKSVEQVEDLNCLVVMVRVGDLDDAFRFAELAYPDNRNLYPVDADEWITRKPLGLDPTWLFSPVMAPLRDDPRFWDIAVRTGLSAYWLSTGSWPDFCAPQPDRCKRLASAAERAHPARRLQR